MSEKVTINPEDQGELEDFVRQPGEGIDFRKLSDKGRERALNRKALAVESDSIEANIADRIADLEAGLDVDNLPSIAQQKEAAGIPEHVNTETASAFGAVVLLKAREQEALNTDTGEMSKGFLILWRPLKEKRYYTTFVGGMLLVRDLRMLQLPVKAKFIKKGRTWHLASV